MNDHRPVPMAAGAGALAPPPPPSLPPEIVSSVTDRHAEFIFDGSPTWCPSYAVRVLTAKGISPERAARALAELDDALKPVPMTWLGDRLTLVWGVFMATRTAEVVDDAVTAWLGEYLRLLGDLPHDVAALAIDRAIQTARHGFIPSIGEISNDCRTVAGRAPTYAGSSRLGAHRHDRGVTA